MSGLQLFGKHKGFITGKDWINVQKLLNINKVKSYRKPQKNTALLTGIIRCRKCGSIMRPRLLTNRFDEEGKQKYIYSCTLKERSRGKKCKGKNIDGNKLDKLLLEEIKKLTAPNEKICEELKKISSTKIDIVNKDDEYIRLKARYDKNQKSLDNLIQRIKYVDIEIIDEINKEIKKIKKENEKLEKRLSEYKSQEKVNQLEIDVSKIVLEIIEKYFEAFETLDIVEKKNLLRLIVDNVVGNGDTVEINLLSQSPDNFFNTTLLPIGEYRKRNFNVFKNSQKN